MAKTAMTTRLIAAGIVVGFGVHGYLLALQGLHRISRLG